MNIKEFKKVILKTNWYDKYYYYLISVAIIFVGIFFIYDRFQNPVKYYSRNTHYFIFFAAFFFISLGAIAFYRIPNRYKVLTFINTLSTEEKKLVLSKIMKEYGQPFNDSEKQIWSFTVGNWPYLWYNVWLTFDENNFYASVILGTVGKSGFIDFGGTEKFRKKLSSVIETHIQT